MNVFPDIQSFTRNWSSGKNQAVWTRIISDTETPVSAFIKLRQNKPYCFLLESIEGGETRGRYSIIGREPDLIWRCDHGGKASINRQALISESLTPEQKPPIESLRALLTECSIDDKDQPKPVTAGLFGYLGYDMVRYAERVPVDKPDVLGVPEAFLIRPTLLAIFDQIENTITLLTPTWFKKNQNAESAFVEAQQRLKRAVDDLMVSTTKVTAAIDSTSNSKVIMQDPLSNFTEGAFCNTVERAKEYIRAGDIFQVVLSQRFTIPFSSSAFELYRTVRRSEPSPFLFFIDLKEFSIVGSSPEILVRLRDNKVTIRPIAGTRPRGIGNRTDAELQADLLADPKELAEHLMLLDLGRNDVARVSKVGSVKVTARNTIEYYKHVMHIVSNVEGELDTQYSPLDALLAGFPAGTVSGSPKIRAMEIIAELEPDRRGIYAGCIGYFGANGTMDNCIAIRTALIKDGQLHVQAGAGIVYDSDPQTEYRECVAKARGMIRAVEETLRAIHDK
jgi:anthranilate synthase component 1